MSETFPPDEIARIKREVSLERLVGARVQLRRAGGGAKGLCPFHKEKTPSFTVSDDRGFFHCFGCGAHGDVIRWVQETEGLDFKAAMAALGARIEAGTADRQGATHFAARPGPDRDADTRIVSSASAGRWIWETSAAAKGTIVEGWLRYRGLDPHALGGAMLAGLRFHPDCPCAAWRADSDPRGHWLRRPAMIVGIRDADGQVRGVHVTWLQRDGFGKADLPAFGDGDARPGRKIFGRLGGCTVWLAPFDAENPQAELIAGEGIETSWAFAQACPPSRTGENPGVIAALSLENMQGAAARLRDGSLPLWRLAPDPARPAATVAFRGAVTLLIDADMKLLRDQRVQFRRGEPPVKGTISGIERAQICATLATANWRAAGAAQVSAVRPPMGQDFNDLMKEKAS